MQESELLRSHLPCPSCGSSDAYAEYSDGHGYCFSCRYTQPSTQNTRKKRTGKMAGALLTDLTRYPTLTKRKLSADTIRKFGYKSTTIAGVSWHVAPYYNADGELAAQHLRGPEKQFRWRGCTQGLQLFGQHLWPKGGKRIIVTEGEIDCMSVSQIMENRWPVVSIPSGVNSAAQAFKDNMEFLESYDKVIICFDNDGPGQKAAREVAPLLSPSKACIAQLPLKDPSDMLVAGRTKELMSCMWNAQEYRPDGILDGPSLWEALSKDPEVGLATPFEGLNAATLGVRKGELWLFTAGSGIGKSTIVHEIAYKFLMQDGQKIGVMALEESKRRTAERYLGIYLNRPIHLNREGVSQAQLEDAFKSTIGAEPCRFELYDHFGSTNIDTLINKIRYMFVGLGVDIVVLDHISITVSGLEGNEISEGERRTLDILMTKLRSLIEETGKTIIAVSHLKRPEQGKSWNEGREPRLTDLRGSASLEQLSDVVVALHRNQSDTEQANRAGILVLKNRPVGITGSAGHVRYVQETGRLLPEADGAAYFGKEPAHIPSGSDKDYELDF